MTNTSYLNLILWSGALTGAVAGLTFVLLPTIGAVVAALMVWGLWALLLSRDPRGMEQS